METNSKEASNRRYMPVRGKLSKEDSRKAYVTMIFPDGQRRPIASFWSFQEAVKWARKMEELESESNLK